MFAANPANAGPWKLDPAFALTIPKSSAVPRVDTCCHGILMTLYWVSEKMILSAQMSLPLVTRKLSIWIAESPYNKIGQQQTAVNVRHLVREFAQAWGQRLMTWRVMGHACV